MKSRLLITLISAVLILGGQSMLGSSASATGSGGGYTWVQQSPYPGGDVISSTSAISSTSVWSVAGQGSAFYWNGTSLSKQWTGTTNDLYGVSAPVSYTHLTLPTI